VIGERETRLRERIDALVDDRQRLRVILAVANGRGRATRPCVYCGHRTQTSKVVPVCPSHADVFQLDPVYNDLRSVEAETDYAVVWEATA
jgi:hypothetical protein